MAGIMLILQNLNAGMAGMRNKTMTEGRGEKWMAACWLCKT